MKSEFQVPGVSARHIIIGCTCVCSQLTTISLSEGYKVTSCLTRLEQHLNTTLCAAVSLFLWLFVGLFWGFFLCCDFDNEWFVIRKNFLWPPIFAPPPRPPHPAPWHRSESRVYSTIKEPKTYWSLRTPHHIFLGLGFKSPLPLGPENLLTLCSSWFLLVHL